MNGKPQYEKDGAWYDVDYEKRTDQSVDLEPLKLTYQPVEHYDDPKYYIHFTLSKLADGEAQLLTYDEEATWKRDFEKGVELEKGDYLLTTGTRLASGKVLAHLERFTIGDTPSKMDFTMREDKEEAQVIGSLNAEDLYFDHASQSKTSILATTGRGFYVLGIVAPNQEPTNHALRDISVYKEQMEKWGRKMLLLFQNDDEAQRFNFAEFDKLPNTVIWGIDVDGKIRQEVWEQMKLTSPSLPVFLICDTFNRVVFISQGYTINLGEQLMKIIRKL